MDSRPQPGIDSKRDERAAYSHGDSRAGSTDPVLWLRDHPLALTALGFFAMLVMDVVIPNLIYFLRPL